MRIVGFVIVALLLAGGASATPRGDVEMAVGAYTIVDVKSMKVPDEKGKDVVLEVVLAKDRRGNDIALVYYHHLLIIVDPAPMDVHIPAMVDSGFCPVNDKSFPSAPGASNVFIVNTECPKRRTM